MNLRVAVALLVVAACVPAWAALEITFVQASAVALENPHDLKLSPDGKYLFVSDVGNNRVVALDPETLAFIAEFGADHQSGTHDIDFDAAGLAYVADTHNNRVTIYKMDGAKGSLIGQLSERIRGPEGVLAHPNGLIYVAGAWSGNVVAYKDGKVASELGGLSSPHDVELTPDGDIWLADAGNDCIVQYLIRSSRRKSQVAAFELDQILLLTRARKGRRIPFSSQEPQCITCYARSILPGC